MKTFLALTFGKYLVVHYKLYIKQRLEFPFFCLFPVFFRLHGSYERLWAGQVSEALVDLTGGLAERWSLGDCGSEEEQRAQQDSDQVRRRWLDLKHLDPVRHQCALSCSTHDSPGGHEKYFFTHTKCFFFFLCVTSSDDLCDYYRWW